MAIKGLKVVVVEVLESLFEMNEMKVVADEMVEVKASYCYCYCQICCHFVTPLTFFVYLNLCQAWELC